MLDMAFARTWKPSSTRPLRNGGRCCFSATLPREITNMASAISAQPSASPRPPRASSMATSNIVPSPLRHTRWSAPWSMCCAILNRPARWSSARHARRCALNGNLLERGFTAVGVG